MRYPKNAIQKILEKFHDSDRDVLRVPYSVPDQYSTKNSAQNAWRTAIKTSGYKMKCIIIDSVLYIIKLDPDHQKAITKSCSNCMYSLEDGFYNPEGWTCKDCVRASKWRER